MPLSADRGAADPGVLDAALTVDAAPPGAPLTAPVETELVASREVAGGALGGGALVDTLGRVPPSAGRAVEEALPDATFVGAVLVVVGRDGAAIAALDGGALGVDDAAFGVGRDEVVAGAPGLADATFAASRDNALGAAGALDDDGDALDGGALARTSGAAVLGGCALTRTSLGAPLGECALPRISLGDAVGNDAFMRSSAIAALSGGVLIRTSAGPAPGGGVLTRASTGLALGDGALGRVSACGTLTGITDTLISPAITFMFGGV
jgi:hypothetical protein